MSIKHLTIEEKATYSLGLAMLRPWDNQRQGDEGVTDPETQGVMDAVFRWAEQWLTEDELFAITDGIGVVFDEAFRRACEEANALIRQVRENPVSDGVILF